MYNVGGQLRIDEEGNPVQVGEGQHKANMNNMAGRIQTVMAQFAAIHQENIDLRELVMTQYDVMRDELLRLRRVVSRVANRPVMINHGFVNCQGAQPQGGGGGGGDKDPEDSTVPYEAMLSNCPRSLFELWQEYKFGLQGQKAAKRFTSQERGRRVKYKYHRRKVVWDTVLRLLGRGHSIHRAVGEIERVYGEVKTVSTYINLLWRDRRVGHHRDLRLFFYFWGKFFPVTDIDSPLSLYLDVFFIQKHP